MTNANAQLVQFLQQEKIRLDKTLAENQNKEKRLHLQLETLSSLYWVSQNIWQESQSLETLDTIMQQCLSSVGATDGSISILDEETDELYFFNVQGLVRDQLTGFRIKADAGIAGWVMTSGETVVIDDARQDWRFSMVVDEAFSFSTRSMLCVPIVDDNRRLGVIQWLNKEQHQPFTDIDMTMGTVFSDVAAKILRMHLSPMVA